MILMGFRIHVIPACNKYINKCKLTGPTSDYMAKKSGFSLFTKGTAKTKKNMTMNKITQPAL